MQTRNRNTQCNYAVQLKNGQNIFKWSISDKTVWYALFYGQIFTFFVDNVQLVRDNHINNDAGDVR